MLQKKAPHEDILLTHLLVRVALAKSYIEVKLIGDVLKTATSLITHEVGGKKISNEMSPYQTF